MPDRRRNQRFPLNLPVRLKWSQHGRKVEQTGALQDISSIGVYFLLSGDVEPHGRVEFEVPLQIEGAPEGGVLLQCIGRVVRVESKEPEQKGVAVSIYRYRLTSLPETQPDPAPPGKEAPSSDT